MPKGRTPPAIIVLMTDGENTQQPDPVDAAKAAADRGVRIDTVGIGSPAGTTLEVEGFRVHTPARRAALQAIAELTDGTYYAAARPGELSAIYDDVGHPARGPAEPIEVTSLFAGAGFLLLLIGGAPRCCWFGRLP